MWSVVPNSCVFVALAALTPHLTSVLLVGGVLAVARGCGALVRATRGVDRSVAPVSRGTPAGRPHRVIHGHAARASRAYAGTAALAAEIQREAHASHPTAYAFQHCA
eukprot:15468532-Alexandrium_andersonii.AAC.1